MRSAQTTNVNNVPMTNSRRGIRELFTSAQLSLGQPQRHVFNVVDVWHSVENDAAPGAIVPNEVIELLRPQTVIRLGAPTELRPRRRRQFQTFGRVYRWNDGSPDDPNAI